MFIPSNMNENNDFEFIARERLDVGSTNWGKVSEPFWIQFLQNFSGQFFEEK